MMVAAANRKAAASPPQSKRTSSDRDINAIGKRTIARSTNLISLDKERAIGKQYAQEFERGARRLDDPAVASYLDHLAENLARNSDAQIPITVRVINSEAPNAYVLPGGFLYVTSGLILQVENEGELAGMLAHGIAHTALRNGTRNASNGELPIFEIIPAPFILPPTMAGWGIYEGMVNVVPIGFSKFQRDAEYDADFFGLQYVYKTGYDPDCFIRFIGRMGHTPTSGRKVPANLSPIPPASDRVKAMNKEVAEILPSHVGAIISSADFEAFKDRVRSLQSPSPQFK